MREFPIDPLIDYSFSPKETYITIWTRYIKPTDGDTPSYNLIVYDILNGQKSLLFTQKLPGGWDVQWTEDEAYCAKQVGSHIQVFHSANLNNTSVVSKLQLEGLQSFSLSPGKRPVLAVFTTSKSGPCSSKIYDLANVKQPLAQKTFMRADSVTFYWSALGTNVLVFTHTDVDATGQSYYGESKFNIN